MKANKTIVIIGGITAGMAAIAIYKWIKHEAAEMKREEEAKRAAANQAEPTVFERFNNYPKQYWNYVDEGFMGFTANEGFMMLGGGKTIEFANASGHKVSVATDEPNFAYADGAQKGQGTTARGRKIYPHGRFVSRFPRKK